MIYLGVEVYRKSLKIVALSELFTPLDTLRVTKDDSDRIKQWVKNIRPKYDETVKWFFDKAQFDQIPFEFIERFDDDLHQFYTVPHRAIAEIRSAFHDYWLFEGYQVRKNGIAWFLAAAVRVINPALICRYNPEWDKPF